MDPPSPRSGFCYLPTPAKAIAKSHKNQTTIAGEKRWPRDSFSSTCLKAMFQGEGSGSRSQQSKETQRKVTKTQLFGPWLSRSIHTYTLCATSVPDITINALYSRGQKGNVRFALTPVQTHQRSLTAHWSSSAHTPIWPLLHFPLICAKPWFSARPGRENNKKKRADGENGVRL